MVQNQGWQNARAAVRTTKHFNCNQDQKLVSQSTVANSRFIQTRGMLWSAKLDRKSSRTSCLIRFPLPAASSQTENISRAAFPMVVLALLPTDGAHKCRSTQKSNVLGGELIKCFQTSKKKKKRKSQFRQSSSFGVKLQRPLGLFCSEAINLFLEIVPQRAYQEQQSQFTALPLFCFVWSVCHRVNQESCCILSAKGKYEPSHLRILHSSRVRYLLYFPHFLLLSS